MLAMMVAPAFPIIPVRKAKRRKAHPLPGAEASALAYLREEKCEQAIAVLEAAVARELMLAAPSLRLLDLLATLYARKGRLAELSALAARVEATAQGNRAAAMLDRAGKWRNEQSKWRRDRADLKAAIKWRAAKHQPDDIVIIV